MINFFKTYLYEPILSALVFIYENLAFHDLGLAIIVLTVFIRIVLFPLFYKSAKDQSLMQRLQPHVKKIQEDHTHNKEEQARALMSLYKEHRFNPFSGFLLIIVQLPILIALYQVFLKGLASAVFENKFFLGLVDLGEKSLFIAVIAALLQFFQSKLAMPASPADDKKSLQQGAAASVSKTMLYFGPLLTLMILATLPSALGIYWATSTLISLGQQLYINRRLESEPLNKHGGLDGKSK